MDEHQRRTDVFLSCARPQLAQGQEIYNYLCEAGLTVWFEGSVQRENLYAEAERGISSARSHLILLTERTPSAWQQAELDFAERASTRHPTLETIPLIIEGYQPSPLLGERLERFEAARLPWAAHRREVPLRELLERLKGPPGVPYMIPEESDALYPNMRPYRLNEGRIFFGRERETAEALSRLGQQPDGGFRRWLRILGEPGTGCSSFMTAGLVPGILRGGIVGAPAEWEICLWRPDPKPRVALAEALARILPAVELEELQRLLEEETGLVDLVRERLAPDQGLLILLDELDELDALSSPEELDAFDALLAAALGDFDQRLFILSTEWRSDLEGFPRLYEVERSGAALFELGGLSRPGLRWVIEGPPALAARRWPPELALSLADEAEKHVHIIGSLSWVLASLADGPKPSLERLHSMGRLSDSLQETLDAEFGALTPHEQAHARDLLLALTLGGRGVEDSDRPILYEQALEVLGGGPRAAQLLNKMSSGRLRDESALPAPLLQIEGSERRSVVRLGHRAFLSWWPRLRDWLDADRPILERREDVEGICKAWDRKGHPKEGLLSFCIGEDLVRSQRQRLQKLLSTESRHFVEAAQRAQRALEQEGQEAQEHLRRERAQVQELREHRRRRQLFRLRLLLLLLFTAGCSAALLGFTNHQDLKEMESRIVWAHAQRVHTLKQLREAEFHYLEVEKLRRVTEQGKREVQRQRRSAIHEGLQAQQAADEMLSVSQDLLRIADEHFALIRNKEGPYLRQMLAKALLKQLRERLDEGPNPRLRFLLAEQHRLLAQLALERHTARLALPQLEMAIRIFSDLSKAQESPQRLRALAETQQERARLLGNKRLLKRAVDPTQALSRYKEALETWEQLKNLEPDVESHKESIAEIHARRARLALKLSKPELARREASLAFKMTPRLKKGELEDYQRSETLARREILMGDIEKGEAQSALASQHYEAAAGLLQHLPRGEARESLEALLKRRLRSLK